MIKELVELLSKWNEGCITENEAVTLSRLLNNAQEELKDSYNGVL